MPSLAESRHPGRIDQIRVQREVELDVARAGRDRVSHQRPLDLDRMRDKLGEVDVALVGEPALERKRVSENRGSREGDLERVASDRRHERRLASGRAVDPTQPIDDLVNRQIHRLTMTVTESNDVVGTESLHSVVKRIQEHPPAKFAVAHHIEPTLDLALDHLPDRSVLELGQRAAIPPPLLIQHRRMPRGIEPLHSSPQSPGPQQAPHHFRASRPPRDFSGHPTSLTPPTA